MKETDSIPKLLDEISKTTQVHNLHEALEYFHSWNESFDARLRASILMTLSIGIHHEFSLRLQTIAEKTGSPETPSELTGPSSVSSNESMNDAISSMEISTQRSTQSDVTK